MNKKNKKINRLSKPKNRSYWVDQIVHDYIFWLVSFNLYKKGSIRLRERDTWVVNLERESRVIVLALVKNLVESS